MIFADRVTKRSVSPPLAFEDARRKERNFLIWRNANETGGTFEPKMCLPHSPALTSL